MFRLPGEENGVLQLFLNLLDGPELCVHSESHHLLVGMQGAAHVVQRVIPLGVLRDVVVVVLIPLLVGVLQHSTHTL